MLLFCLILGEAVEERFEVIINTAETIAGFQNTIKKEKKETFKYTDAKKLKLWKVEISTRDENGNDKLKILNSKPHDQIDIRSELEGESLQLDDIVGEHFKRQPIEQISVIVQLSTTTDMHKKMVDEKLMKFWKALKDTEFYSDDDGFLQLSENTHFFGNNDEPSKIFIRKCYNDLINVVFDDNIRNLRITGNPGIGKTFFGYYLLYHLAILDQTVIYDSESNHQVILFNQEKVFYLTTDETCEINRYLDDPNVWYIVDGKKPDILLVAAKTILICSPLKNHYKDFDKKFPSVRYMPVWSWNEINMCRGEIYGNLSKDKVQKLFKMWGGIPRFILKNALNKGIQDQLKRAIELCNVASILGYIDGMESKDNISYKLVHIWTNLEKKEDEYDKEIRDPYTQKTIKFASNYVVEQVTNNVKNSITGRLYENMEVVLKGGKSNDSVLTGNYFEAIAHQMLRGGGEFHVRSLDFHGSPHMLKFSQQNHELRFSKIDDIENNKYYQPIDKTFPSIDAIIAPNSLFQMVTTLDHPIRMIDLNKLWSKLAKTGDINFYFVVPTQLYEKYQKQKYETTEDDVSINIKPQIKQYVLRVDLSSGGSMAKELSIKRTSTSGMSESKNKKKKLANFEHYYVR